jgi:hypothetical protein
MSGWPILDVAIGLAFVYLLLSTICSALTEGITTQLRSRSKYLERGITTLLGEAGKKDFFSHPVIASFANSEGDSLPRKAWRKVKSTLGAKQTSVGADQRPSYLPGDKFAIVARGMAEKKKDEKPLYPELSGAVAEVLKGVKKEDEVEALHVWYDQVMERVSGWYKRHAQVWVKILAIVVVIVVNADTIDIAKVLWADPTVRQVAVEQAKARLRQPPPETVAVEYSDGDETLPEDIPEKVGTPGDSSDKHLGLSSEQWTLLHQLMSWDDDKAVLEGDLQQQKPGSGSSFGVYLGWIWYLLRRHSLGWFVSVVAVSLGAPFWFDALNRLVNIRNTGTVPAKKTDGGEEKKK